MSTGSHRGPLPLLNVSEEEAWRWRQHRLATSKAYEVLFGYPVLFEDLASTDDAFEGVAGVQRLTLQAAEVLRWVFTSHATSESDVRPTLRIGRIHQEVAHRFATRYGITELDRCYAELVRLLASAPGRLSGRRYRAADVRFLDTVRDYASRYERYLMLGLHDEFPGPARPWSRAGFSLRRRSGRRAASPSPTGPWPRRRPDPGRAMPATFRDAPPSADRRSV